jgi:hypothetical protein
MDKQQAQQIIRETFENPFDKERFSNFIKNLLNRVEETSFTYQGQYIPDAYKPYISSLERLYKYTDGEHQIDILVVKLQKETSLERARTMQRNFIAWYLNGSRGGEMKDAALVAFVSPDEADWRFSLVKMDYRFEEGKDGRIKVKEEFTPARRWSFLVGKNEKSHTAQSRLVDILADDKYNPTLAQLEEAFNIETVTKEFFFKYRELFIRTKEALDKVVAQDAKIKADFEAKGVDTVNFAKKLLGQIVFLYFLQKKGWFGVARDAAWGTGSKQFLRELFEGKHGNYTNFFNDILEPLFYEALRIDRSHDDDYYSRFNCKIPFLNGGLFDPIGNYDWVHTDINLPNELFSNNVKTKEGDIGNGILDVFDRYNFTVKEDEPLEKDVAIDPELLGKVYEKFNAIRQDNFEEYKAALKSGETGAENKFNKKFGVYYTPREIVHYMCQQSLINYLSTCAEENGLSEVIKKQDIADLIEVGEMVAEHEATALIKQQNMKNGMQKSTEYTQLLADSIRENAATIDRWLADITVCDPAVGSGAFPVGMMHEIVRARTTLSVFINDSQRNSYEFKRRCIEHSLYGVDIDPGAVEITKLRLWLSLVVDEEDIKNIKPLPNLDYKVVCGNSLLSVEKNLFNNQLFTELERLKPLYFNETFPTKKLEYKKQINELIGQITNGHTEFDFEVYFSEVFHNKGGFDVVIANPPYIQLQNAIDSKLKVADLYKNQNYQTFERTGDIYCLFYEKGIKLLKPKCILTYITSNKWMRAGYGEKLREFFSRQNPLVLVDLGPNVFESATVDTNILIMQKAQNKNQLLATTINENKKDNINIAEYVKQHAVTLSKLSKDAWFIGSEAEQQLKEKIERIGKPLKDWDVNIYYGIKTGLNEAFIITTDKRNEILANCQDDDERKRTEAIIKPILRGRDIKRYYYEWAGLWVIVIPAGWTNENRWEENPTEFIEKTFPSLMQHLKPFEAKAQKRDDQGDYWWELRACAYYPEFEKEKIIYPNMTKFLPFVYDENKMYANPKCYILTGEKLKYLLGVFNSKVCSKWIKENCPELQGGTREIQARVFLNYKVPPITPANESIVQHIESLVDKILAAKKQDKDADTSEWEQEIDRLVYELYGLTEEEIQIIERNEK